MAAGLDSCCPSKIRTGVQLKVRIPVHLNKNMQQLPFTCFRIDEGSQKGHFFVEIHEFSKAIDEIYLKNRQSFTSAVQKSTKPKE